MASTSANNVGMNAAYYPTSLTVAFAVVSRCTLTNNNRNKRDFNDSKNITNPTVFNTYRVSSFKGGKKKKAAPKVTKGSIAQNVQAHMAVLRAITKSTIVKNNISLSSGAGGGYAPTPMGFNYSLPQPVEHPVYGRALTEVDTKPKGTTMNGASEPKSTRSQGSHGAPSTAH